MLVRCRIKNPRRMYQEEGVREDLFPSFTREALLGRISAVFAGYRHTVLPSPGCSQTHFPAINSWHTMLNTH